MKRAAALFVLAAFCAGCFAAEVAPSCADGSGGSGAGGSVAVADCRSDSDCSALKPGVCGEVACDQFGLVNPPSILGVPKGCFVTILPSCDGPSDGGGGDACDGPQSNGQPCISP